MTDHGAVPPASRADRRSDGSSESEERYRALVEACPDPIVVHAAGMVRFVNPAALQLLGASDADEVVGRGVMEFVHPDFRRVVGERMTKMLETGRPAYLLEEKIVRIDGSVRDVEIAGGPVSFRGERAIQLVGRDVTERRRDEARRRQLEERVREARRRDSLLQLGGGIAHELQQLSASLLETVDTSVADGKPVTGARLRSVRKVGLRMQELTEQLLSFVGEHAPAQTLIDLSGIVLELSERLDAEVGAASLGFDLPAHLPRVHADVASLRRIVGALVHNAVDAIGSGVGNVGIRTLRLELDAVALADFHPFDALAPGEYVAIEVRDTGCGMDEETRSRVLDPFFSTKSPGRGLALAEVLGLVGAARGGIRVASTKGRGTTVTVAFPSVPPAEGTSAPKPKSRGR